MGGYSGIAIFIAMAAGPAMAARPVEKSGPCPRLEREPIPSPQDNWGQFAVKPTAEFQTNCSNQNPQNCTIQKALAPAQSINCIEPAPGLKLQLWASEEMAGNMKYIQHFSFDERGRVWAVEPVSYPNAIRPASGTVTDQKFAGGKDRIVILEDTDGDKVMDKFKVFRDGLNLPQSIECVNGGVVVTMTPYIVFFANNDDTAGTPRILFSGMGSGGTSWDTHGGINQIMYGLDNWIYGSTGFNGGCKAVPGNVHCGHGRVWRFRHTALGHDRTEFQVWSVGPQNSDGLGQMEDGQIFQSGATGTSHMNHAAVQKDDPSDDLPAKTALDIRTRHPAYNTPDNDVNVYYPATRDHYLWEGDSIVNKDGWHTSRTTASSGVQFYTSRLFPKKYWNRFVFTCEGATKLCNQDSLVESGSSWKAYRLPGPAHANLLASTDAWVAPLLAKTGPDGAVWVLDWNNYLFLHNPAGPMGPGSAWQNSLRTKNSNRIYRVTPADGSVEPVWNLADATEDQLLAALGSPNFFWRLTAQRLLIAKASATAIPKLAEILRTNKELDEVGNSPRVQHALWTLDGMGGFAKDPAAYIPILQGLLKHPAWCVRRNALRVMPRTPEGAAAINSACSVNDPHAHVRLQALLAMGAMPAKPSGLNPIQAAYANIDATAASAQQASGVPIGTPACAVAPDPSTPFVSYTASARGPAAPPLPGLRFEPLADGFRLSPHGGLPSGTLSVYEIRGRRVFRAEYDAKRSAWSVPRAWGLSQPIYGYAFQGADGSIRRGILALSGAR